MAIREDLLALRSDSLAALTNRGLVKRASREIARGEGPAVAVDEAGCVTGTFTDGIVARLPAGVAIGDASCTCGATTVCRHAVAVVLAYGAGASQNADDSASEAGVQQPAGEWDPGAFTDEELKAAMGAPAMRRAKKLVAKRLVVKLEPGQRPAAHLPTCSVIFHVPGDLTYAQCDCALRGPCEHVAVAAWAFARDKEQKGGPVSFGSTAATMEPGELSALDEVLELVYSQVLAGVVHSGAGLAQRFALVRQALARQRLHWPHDAVEGLEEQLGAYRSRSARYSAEAMTRLLVELAARREASRHPGAEPAELILGTEQAPETRLDQVRLISLGARLRSDEEGASAEIYLAEPVTSAVMVMRKSWDDERSKRAVARDLVGRTVAPSARLATIARGQVVTRVARRRPNRALLLGRGRGKTSVTGQRGSWRELSEPLRINSVRSYLEAVGSRPPWMIRPRVLAENLHVVEVGGAQEVFYVPGAQQLWARLVDREGDHLWLVQEHRSASPDAIDVVGQALTNPGALRFVAGELRPGAAGLHIYPTALVTEDRIVVPDIDEAEAPWQGEPLSAITTEDPLARAVHGALAAVEQGAHRGLMHASSSWLDQVEAHQKNLSDVGLEGTATKVGAFVAQARGLLITGGNDKAAAKAYLGAAARLHVMAEQHGAR